MNNYKSLYYEIDRIIKSLQNLLQDITDSNLKLQNEGEKIEFILSNMAEGFVLIDSSMNILLCNNSARKFFSFESELKPESIYGLTRNQNILNALQSETDNNQSSVFDLELNEGLIVNLYISPSKIAENEFGVTMFIVDMTAKKLLEQQKRDFFSNASHELKTPITSILGFAE